MEGLYRGREGQWAYFLHRISGLAIALYLFIHVVNISLAMFGPEVANRAMVIFHVWPFRVGLLAIIAGSIYHALNGLRLIAMDLTGWGVSRQRPMWYGVLALSVVLFTAVAIKVVPEIVRGMMS
jgi:succinate dehydrogenase / fumarate reductase cytochrome b subunit